MSLQFQLWRLRLENCCKFKGSLVYISSSRPVSTAIGRLCLKIKQKPNNNKKKIKSALKMALVKGQRPKLQGFCVFPVG